jgi:hypothetical protein
MKTSIRSSMILLVLILICACVETSPVDEFYDLPPKVASVSPDGVETIALWLFDEAVGLYPSHILEDHGEQDYPLALGLGGQVVKGRFGNALEPSMHVEIPIPEGDERYGLTEMSAPEGRTMRALSWHNAQFAAFMTLGENHLRKEAGYENPTSSDLNLAASDWTVEFWFQGLSGDAEGIVFEIGTGPRGEEGNQITQLKLAADRTHFIFINEPSSTMLSIPTDDGALVAGSQWVHLAFSHRQGQVTHYVNGQKQELPEPATLQALPEGEEAYMSLLRDGLWEFPLQGRIDELHFAKGVRYADEFSPASLQPQHGEHELNKGPLPLFGEFAEEFEVLPLGGRKHVFIDDAIIAEKTDISFNVNPPRLAEKVMDIEGDFRKHLTVVEDEDGLIRIYNSVEDDYMAVYVSTDGINFTKPVTGIHHKGIPNIVLPQDNGGLGNPFIDPNGPPEHRWKYISDFSRRGIYLYTSPDGYDWTLNKTWYIPYRSGTQSCTFYDDQRQVYVGYHRTGVGHTPGGATDRRSIRTESTSLFEPHPFKPVSYEESMAAKGPRRLRHPQPWWLDNGPLAPGGPSIELPHDFEWDPEMDPIGTDFYITKATKYEYAPDMYVAFPTAYFHYEADGPLSRQVLYHPSLKRGSGPIETQLSVSRDGLNWKRTGRPTYVGNGKHDGHNIVQAYLSHGMVRRGDEIWQYYYGTEFYHSRYTARSKATEFVFRVVQRLDGFVSADSPYDRLATMKTKPLSFEGDRLELNIDTDAVGYALVGLMNPETGKYYEGFSPDECVYVNGDETAYTVSWLRPDQALLDLKDDDMSKFKRTDHDITAYLHDDVSELAGKPVQVVIHMRGTKLYALQFTTSDEEG